MVNHDNQEEDIDKLGDLENMEESLQSLWQDLGFQCCTRCPKKNSAVALLYQQATALFFWDTL